MFDEYKLPSKHRILCLGSCKIASIQLLAHDDSEAMKRTCAR
jgi:hypothetical protein